MRIDDMQAAEVATDTTGHWWAAGDMPVRLGCKVEPLIDGRAAMFAMCLAFLRAERYILLAGWDIRADLPMVRGEDAHVAEPGSPQQRAFVETLRSDGFGDEAIALWTSSSLRVTDVLGLAVRRGVRVGVLIWDAFHMGSHITNDPAKQRAALQTVGVDCLLDDSSRHVEHITQALHQKCAVVDGVVAFVGGVDLTVQDGGDYDRWDTHHHPCASRERIAASRSAACHPWHDVHTRIEGPAVADVQRNIVQRWGEVAARHQAPLWPVQLPHDAPAPLTDGVPAQVVRTIPPVTYAFAPQGIETVKAAYLSALAQAHSFVYLENQYLWPEVFLGFDDLRWGGRSAEMMEVLEALAGALERGVRIAMTLPDHPNCGRRFTDGGVEWLRQRAAAVGASDHFQAFTLGNGERDDDLPNGIFYRPVYTHAKVAIVDDTWWTAGSANLNSRGMRSDAEINISVCDPATARELRLRLWTEHLRRSPEQRADVEDALTGLSLLRRLASENLTRLGQGKPLQGHILPYLTAEDGRHLGIHVHSEHGLLDMLEGGAGPHAPHHAGRYI